MPGLGEEVLHPAPVGEELGRAFERGAHAKPVGLGGQRRLDEGQLLRAPDVHQPAVRLGRLEPGEKESILFVAVDY